MIEYKNQLRVEVNLRKGTIAEPDLNQTSGYESDLDKEIIACASRNIKGQNLMTFFWAYHCLNSWEDIQMKFFTHLNRELEVSTIKRYAQDAAKRIVGRF